MLQGARDARPELLASKAREQAAEAAVREARAGNWPSLSASGTASRTTIEGRGSAAAYSGGLRVDLPIFSGFSVKGAIDQARAAVDQTQADTESLRLAVEQQVWVAYQNVQTSRKGLD